MESKPSSSETNSGPSSNGSIPSPDAPLLQLLEKPLRELSDAELRAHVAKLREQRLSPQTLKATLRGNIDLNEDLSEIPTKNSTKKPASAPVTLDLTDLL